MSSANVNVKVAVRIRPLIPKEQREGCSTCLEVESENQVRIGSQCFAFSAVFDQSDDQGYVYDLTVGPLIDNIFQGHNVTIFAYGQTGSGKTYTMGTNDTSEALKTSSCGIIPRALKDIFSSVTEYSSAKEFSVSISYVELYKEEFRDLLAFNPGQSIALREAPLGGGPVLVGCTDAVVMSFDEVIDLLAKGNERRAVGATAMNAASSRSHAILNLTVKQHPIGTPDDMTMAKFRLVDLAGSESVKKTGAVGERLQEGIKINRGLLALGNVIEQAVKGQTMSVRDSKLTRLLQDSFGGNAHTLMLACVSPADTNLSESLNTLRYADRAQHIKNKPVVNRDPIQALIASLRKENAELRAMLGLQGTVLNVQEPAELGPSPPKKARTTFLIEPREAKQENDDSQDMEIEISNVEVKRELESLDESIARKENLIQNETVVTVEEINHMNCMVHELESELENIKAEKKRLEMELSSKQNKEKVGDDRRKRLKELEDKLAKTTRELERASKDRESLKRKQADYEKKTAEYAAELQTLKSTRVNLMKKLKDEANTKRKEQLQMKREIEGVKQQNRKIVITKERLIAQREMENKVLRKRLEECNQIISRHKTIDENQAQASKYKHKMQESLANAPKAKNQMQILTNWIGDEVENFVTRSHACMQREEMFALRKKYADEKLEMEEAMQADCENMTEVDNDKYRAEIEDLNAKMHIVTQQIGVLNSVCGTELHSKNVMPNQKRLDELARTAPELRRVVNILFCSLVDSNARSKMQCQEIAILKSEKSELKEQLSLVTTQLEDHKERFKNAFAEAFQDRTSPSELDSTISVCMNSMTEEMSRLKEARIQLINDKAALEAKVATLTGELQELRGKFSIAARYNRRSNIMPESFKSPKKVIACSPLGPLLSEKRTPMQSVSEKDEEDSSSDSASDEETESDGKENSEEFVHPTPRPLKGVYANFFSYESPSSPMHQDDSKRDPDWQKTPLQKRVSACHSRIQRKTLKGRGAKVQKCECKGDCSKNRCGCRKRNASCTNHCFCTNCTNNKIDNVAEEWADEEDEDLVS